MYSYDQQDSYWGGGDYQWQNDMVEQQYDTYNERYQSMYSPPTNESSNIEAMLALFLINQEKAEQEFQLMKQKMDCIALQQEKTADQLAQQQNQSWDIEYEDDVDGTYEDELLEYSFGQPDQAEKELCKDNASLSEECIPETPEYPPTIEKFEVSVDSKIELEPSTLVDDLICEEYTDPFLQHTDGNSRLNLDVLVKKEHEDWAPLHFIEDFKRVSILLEVNVEDPFLIMPPLSKFECFNPFIIKLHRESNYCPLIQKAITHLKRMGMHLEVHCRLDGRRFKWDLKVD